MWQDKRALPHKFMGMVQKVEFLNDALFFVLFDLLIKTIYIGYKLLIGVKK